MEGMVPNVPQLSGTCCYTLIHVLAPHWDLLVAVAVRSPAQQQQNRHLLTTSQCSPSSANGRFGFTPFRSFVRQHDGLQVGTDGLATAQNYDPVTRPRRQSERRCLFSTVRARHNRSSVTAFVSAAKPFQ